MIYLIHCQYTSPVCLLNLDDVVQKSTNWISLPAIWREIPFSFARVERKPLKAENSAVRMLARKTDLRERIVCEV
jgi:hypothetical protein